MYELIIKRKKKTKSFKIYSEKNNDTLIKEFNLVLEKKIKLNDKDILCCINYKNNIIIGTEDRSIKIYNTSNNKIFTINNAHASSIYSFIILDNKLLSCSSDRTIKIWDLENYKLLETFLAHDNYVYGLYKLSENIFTSFSLDKTIKIWDFKEKKIIRVIKTINSSPLCIEITKEFIFVGLGNGNINIYDIKTSKLIKEFKAHDESINTIIVSDKYIFSAGRDRSIKIWDNNFSLEKEFIAHKSNIWKLIINSNRLISISDDKSIKLWNINNFENIEILQVHNDWVSDICSSNSNIYTVSGDGNLNILNKVPYYDCSKINLEKEKLEKSPFETIEEYNKKINDIEIEFEKRLINYEYINIGNIEFIFDNYNLEEQYINIKAHINCNKIINIFKIKEYFKTRIKLDIEIAKEIYRDNRISNLYIRFFTKNEYKFYFIFKSILTEIDYKEEFIEEEKNLPIKMARLQISPLKPDKESKILDLEIKDINKLNLADTFKTPFETDNDFINRMIDKLVKNEIYNIGKLELSAINYSIDNNSFPFTANINIEKILNIIECQKNFNGQIFIEKNKARNLFENNKIQNLYIQFIKNNNEIGFYLYILFNKELFYIF